MGTIELYRRTTIGNCLTAALDELVSDGMLPPELAIKVLVQYDKTMLHALKTRVNTNLTIKGHLRTYRFCDDVWTFNLRNATFKSEEISETLRRVKIVACDSKLQPLAEE